MADDGSVEGAIWPAPKFYFDTKIAAEKAGWSVGEPYVAVSGDSLKSIAIAHYGSERFYGRVAHYNGLNKFRSITAGQQIFFPPIVTPLG